MIRKSFSLLALALVAAAVAAPIAQSSSTPKVDPLAVGYLIGQGLTPSQVSSWTSSRNFFVSVPTSRRIDSLWATSGWWLTCKVG